MPKKKLKSSFLGVHYFDKLVDVFQKKNAVPLRHWNKNKRYFERPSKFGQTVAFNQRHNKN